MSKHKFELPNFDISRIAWFEVHLKNGDIAFMCPNCFMVSFHPKDLEQKYCGNCHEFKNYITQAI